MFFLGQLTGRRRGKEHLERERGIHLPERAINSGRAEPPVLEMFQESQTKIYLKLFSHWALLGQGGGAGDFLSLGSVFQGFMTLAGLSQTFCIVMRTRKDLQSFWMENVTSCDTRAEVSQGSCDEWEN